MDIHSMSSKIHHLESEMWQKAPGYKLDQLENTVRNTRAELERETQNRYNLESDIGRRLIELQERLDILENPPRAAWRGAVWRVIEPYLTGRIRGHLGAWILEGRTL